MRPKESVAYCHDGCCQLSTFAMKFVKTNWGVGRLKSRYSNGVASWVIDCSSLIRIWWRKAKNLIQQQRLSRNIFFARNLILFTMLRLHMRAFLIYVVTVALVRISSTSSLYATASAASPSKSNVITLTDSNFSDILKSNDLWLIDFYAPWCQHCKVLDVSTFIAIWLLYAW